jgi:hypothetical protein
VRGRAPEGPIGRSLRRQEDPRLLRGKGQYVADLAPPGLLHLAVVRSPHAHARILGIDVRAAAVVPGAVAVLTASDLDGIGALPVLAHPPGQRQSEFPVLPADRALYAGQPVAAVVGESRYAAEDALEAVRVEWDPLPALTDVVRATAPGAPRLYEAWPDNVAVGREIGPGIPDGLFEAAHTVVEAAFSTPRQTAAPLEGRGICAAWDAEAGALTVWASSQAPHQFRTVLAGVLGLDEERIRVIVPDVGGGFGVKLHYYPEDVLACVAAMRLRRPVRWIEDRREHFVATVHAREQTVCARAAFDAGGTLLALDVHVRGYVGAHLHTKGGGPIFLGGVVLPGQYAVRHFRARLEGVVTNKVPFGAYRAFGMQQAAFVIERLMDVAAERLGIDPAEIRRRNYPPPAAGTAASPGSAPAVDEAGQHGLHLASVHVHRHAVDEAGPVRGQEEDDVSDLAGFGDAPELERDALHVGVHHLLDAQAAAPSDLLEQPAHQSGLHRARVDGIDVDALRAILLGQSGGEDQFGRAADGRHDLPVGALHAIVTHHIDDAASALSAHHRESGPGAAYQPQELELDPPFPIVVSQLLDIAPRRDPGAVDQDVETPKSADDVLHQSLGLSPPAQVDGHADHGSAGGPGDLGRPGLQVGLRARADGDVRPLLGEPPRDVSADAARPPGHEHYPVFQSELHDQSSTSCRNCSQAALNATRSSRFSA